MFFSGSRYAAMSTYSFARPDGSIVSAVSIRCPEPLWRRAITAGRDGRGSTTSLIVISATPPASGGYATRTTLLCPTPSPVPI